MSDHYDILQRFAAIQDETFTCVAFPYFFGWAADFPYWTNRISPATYEWDSQDLQNENRIITSRLIVAHATEGWEAQPEIHLFDYMQQWIEEIGCRTWLRSTAYPTPLDILSSEPKAMLNDTGLEFFNDYGIPHIQVGIEFQTQITLQRQHIPS